MSDTQGDLLSKVLRDYVNLEEVGNNSYFVLRVDFRVTGADSGSHAHYLNTWQMTQFFLPQFPYLWHQGSTYLRVVGAGFNASAFVNRTAQHIRY